MAAPKASKVAGSSSDVGTIRADRAGKRCEALLDEALTLTFPASDPVALEFAIAARDRQIGELAFAAGFEKVQPVINHPAEVSRRARKMVGRAAKAKLYEERRAAAARLEEERRAAAARLAEVDEEHRAVAAKTAEMLRTIKTEVEAVKDDARVGRHQRQRASEGGRISGEKRRERSARSAIIRAAKSRLGVGEPREGLAGRLRADGVTTLSERQINRILVKLLGPAGH